MTEEEYGKAIEEHNALAYQVGVIYERVRYLRVHDSVPVVIELEQQRLDRLADRLSELKSAITRYEEDR